MYIVKLLTSWAEEHTDVDKISGIFYWSRHHVSYSQVDSYNFNCRALSWIDIKNGKLPVLVLNVDICS